MEPQPDFGEQSYRGSGKLTDRVALITGADSGIGRAVALAFAREGADVLIAYLDQEDDAQETARVVRAAGRRAVTMAGDIRDEGHCQALVDRAVADFGHLDLLVNNAAYQNVVASVQELTSADWDRAFQTNIFATFYLSKAALRVLPAGGSSSTRPRSRPTSPAPHCSTTRAPRGRSSPSPRAWPRKRSNKACASTPSPPARSGRR
jgi:NAD(P)-dependent dehydrogenase (short-subunit alcohol dehydrogenase family)